MAKEDKIVFCTGGGCTAKLGAGVLSHILEKLPRGEKDPDLLVGYDSRDDAAVYRITDDIALVQTVDFFPPMVDDPYTFGQIAAANALSDVYAMGGEVKTALNLVCFPESMDLNILGEICAAAQKSRPRRGARPRGRPLHRRHWREVRPVGHRSRRTPAASLPMIRESPATSSFSPRRWGLASSARPTAWAKLPPAPWTLPWPP